MRICNLSGTSSHQKIVMTSSLSMHWIVIIFLSFGIFCSALAFFAAKHMLERRINQQRRIQGSPNFITSYPNQYSSLPMKDVSFFTYFMLIKNNLIFNSSLSIINLNDNHHSAEVQVTQNSQMAMEL